MTTRMDIAEAGIIAAFEFAFAADPAPADPRV